MPVFTQVCPAETVTEGMLMLATCTCEYLPDEDMILVDSDDSDVSSCNDGQRRDLFVNIDGVCHWCTCALYVTTCNNTTNQSDSNKMIALLKHQYQQHHQQFLLQQHRQLLRKPPVTMTAPKRKDPFAPVRWQPSRTAHLYAGSRFRGKQKSGSSSYDVMVDIKNVNLAESSLCGYLHINGLTDEYPELTTFFDAEIIGEAFSFKTEKWEADEKTDKEHWALFEPYDSMKDTFGQKTIKSDHHQDQNVLFMRWKEHFLVPDHRVEGIAGASFAGFYYICYNKSTGDIEGYYYHKTSER
ncbi:hypothetical protein BGZ65_002919 [Modicella reniformis]|uniref:Vacuolar import and degradation protein n=1 Tax=Modicella reniformis TaxID=1440133 RepID=A0A9P6STP6_9FUNG|nr:hypothetical protein BGZ65_002919 [Modicella reniformis]